VCQQSPIRQSFSSTTIIFRNPHNDPYHVSHSQYPQCQYALNDNPIHDNPFNSPRNIGLRFIISNYISSLIISFTCPVPISFHSILLTSEKIKGSYEDRRVDQTSI
jgi:hypothetical protein